jgi:hypothetical protein
MLFQASELPGNHGVCVTHAITLPGLCRCMEPAPDGTWGPKPSQAWRVGRHVRCTIRALCAA